MKKIAIFPDKSYGVIETESASTVRINGKDPIRLVDLTDKNIHKYMPELENPQVILDINKVI